MFRCLLYALGMHLPDRPVTPPLDVGTVESIVHTFIAPAANIAAELSEALRPLVAHSSLTILAVDDVRQPRKHAGDAAVLSHLSFGETETIRERLAPGEGGRFDASIGGSQRPVFAVLAETNAVLILTDPGDAQSDEFVRWLWQVLAKRIEQNAQEASPNYLRESRTAAGVRAEAVTELADRYTTTLESLLAILRSPNLEDSGARQAAVQLATEAAVNLRTASDRVLTFSEEPVTKAFERLKSDLSPLLHYRSIDVQFVEPPVDGRALPSEVAYGARAVVRGAILALLNQANIRRVRVQWDCDGKNLLIGVRDDGPGDLSAESIELQPVQQRVQALKGALTIASTRGWGSDMSVVLPLDPPTFANDQSRLSALSTREIEVLERVVSGKRNKSIATELGISENTVKFHLSKIYRRLGVQSRTELSAVVLNHGAPSSPASLGNRVQS